MCELKLVKFWCRKKARHSPQRGCKWRGTGLATGSSAGSLVQSGGPLGAVLASSIGVFGVPGTGLTLQERQEIKVMTRPALQRSYTHTHTHSEPSLTCCMVFGGRRRVVEMSRDTKR